MWHACGPSAWAGPHVCHTCYIPSWSRHLLQISDSLNFRLLSDPPHPETNRSNRSTVVLRASIGVGRLRFAEKLHFEASAPVRLPEESEAILQYWPLILKSEIRPQISSLILRFPPERAKRVPLPVFRAGGCLRPKPFRLKPGISVQLSKNKLCIRLGEAAIY